MISNRHTCMHRSQYAFTMSPLCLPWVTLELGTLMGPQIGFFLIFKTLEIFTMKKLTKLLKNLPQRGKRQRRRENEGQTEEERKNEKNRKGMERIGRT